MKLMITICAALAMGSVFAQETASQKSGEAKQGTAKAEAKPGMKKTAAKMPPQTTTPGLPKTAVEIEPNLWRYIDDKGQVWMYRRTPFGYARYQPEKAVADPDVEEAQFLTAFDLGDTVRFERKTPFGVNKWSRKKSDLTRAEQLALDRASKGPAGASAAKPAQEK